ncbi:hypothetical protein SLA2020_525810 [Shorea laevis]
MAFPGTETQPQSTKLTPLTEIQSVKCDCCGFTEECTPSYIHRVRERYQGRWICGLCVEAVKDMVQRSHTAISTEEALDHHISFCEEFRATSPPAETEHPIIAISRLPVTDWNTLPECFAPTPAVPFQIWKASRLQPGSFDQKVVSQLCQSEYQKSLSLGNSDFRTTMIHS